MTPTSARSLLSPVYEALTRPGTRDVRALLESALAPEWLSYGSAGPPKTREEFVQQVTGFGRAIPDLAFEVIDVIVDGEKVVVRSEATGTPAGDFMGVPHSGRSFRIMTIDIHTVREGKSIAVHHVEDWATAMRQLAAKEAR
jgi:predicted ester cyclase